MSGRTLKALTLAIAALFAVAAQAMKPALRQPVVTAAPAVVTILGNPLKILIGDDTSYQVLNAKIGATFGQIYPGPCKNDTADAGIFAVIAGQLYAPNFKDHPCGTSTGAIKPYLAWTPVSISAVTGNGTAATPYSVTVVVDAGTTGVRLSATYTYVDTEPFFRIRKVITSSHPVAIKVYTGADIFLAGDDDGVPYREPASSSVGGRDCGLVPQYTILLIPTTPADHFDAMFYGNVWKQIGLKGNLSDTVDPICQDNGAALQWSRIIPPGGTTTITSAVSFGDIPSIAQFNVLSVSPPQDFQGKTLTVVINGIGFKNDTTFDFGPGITVTSTTINSATQATVTIAIASSATPGPRDVAGTQSPGGLTATLIQGFTVLERPPCGRALDPRVLCTTDGTGDYLITFTFQNNSTQTIHHLFITSLSGSATATPSYVHLLSPVPPNGTATIGPIRIHGASPGTLTMTLSLHDAELAQCCSFEVRFELPQCSCAQIVEASDVSCRPAGGYHYTFAYQNLNPGPVQTLLITPDVPTGATFSPNVIPLNPPMAFGEIRVFTITIQSAPGPLCFRITSKSDHCDHCCSIRRCIFLPRCIDGPVPLGDTQIQFIEAGIVASSDSNTPGVTFPLPPDANTVDLAWAPIADAVAPGSFVEQRYRAGDAVIATTRTVVGATDSELRTSFDAFGATKYRYDFLSAGRVIGSQSGVPSDVAAMCNGCGGHAPVTDAHFVVGGGAPASEEGPADCPGGGPGCVFAGYTFPELLPFAIANLKFEADEVRVWPEDGVRRAFQLSAVDWQAQGLHDVTFTNLGVTADCNGNGVDDFVDIDSGASLDVDHNGVPDECQGRGGDLDRSLSTGFDQSRGTTLAGGSDDDDWRFVNANRPGKVLLNPHPVWGAALPQSAWISVDGNRGDSLPGVTTLRFENAFCIGSGAATATLDLQVRADNTATVYLNDLKIGGPGGDFSAAPLTIHLVGSVGGEGPFRIGRNVLRVDVGDNGIVTGLDVAGAVRAVHGACDAAATP